MCVNWQGNTHKIEYKIECRLSFRSGARRRTTGNPHREIRWFAASWENKKNFQNPCGCLYLAPTNRWPVLERNGQVCVSHGAFPNPTKTVSHKKAVSPKLVKCALVRWVTFFAEFGRVLGRFKLNIFRPASRTPPTWFSGSLVFGLLKGPRISPAKNSGFCVAFDKIKCFDALGENIPIALFERCGLPPPSVALLRSQWGSHSHSRWCSHKVTRRSPLALTTTLVWR